MPTSRTGLVEKSIEDATVAMITSDPELRADLRELIRVATGRYMHVIKFGAPDARLAAIKAIVPGLLRAMGRVEQSEEEAEGRAAYERLLNAEIAITAGLGTSDLPADAPPTTATAPKKRAAKKST